MTKQYLITGGCATRCFHQEAKHKYIRLFGERYGYDAYEFAPITKVYLCPKEIIMPYNKDYILIAFDYEPQRTGMEVVKMSGQYNTSSFKEKLSLN